VGATWLMAIPRTFGFGTSRVELVSPLPREECVRRLRDLVDGSFTLFGARPLVGRVEEASFNFRKRIGYRNAFQTVTRGTLEQESGQTRLRCRFGLPPFVTGFLIFWCGLVTLFGGAGAVSAIVRPLSGAQPISFRDALLMLLFAAFLVTVGRLFARNEQGEILRILTKTLDAHAMPITVAG
jgi:hypothetical protein